MTSPLLQQVLTSFLLPPLGLALIGGLCGLLAWRGRRLAGLGAVLMAFGLFLLSTPLAANLLMGSLEREDTPALPDIAPGAIVILGAEIVGSRSGVDVGPLTLERLRAGAALHRRTGLPVLVTGGVLSAATPPLAKLMAASLNTDFGVPVRWIEPRAPDTRGNATFSILLLRDAGVGAAYIVTHGWHLPRALAAFQRHGLKTVGVPVRRARAASFRWSDWIARPDHLAESWFALREWTGRLVYALRD